MDTTPIDEIEEELIQAWAQQHVESVFARITPFVTERTEAIQARMGKVLDAFSVERLGTHHFASMTGYGHGDQGREVVDRIFARVLGSEKAAIRLQFVSGTHAIAASLFGVLRPGDQLLSVTGRPYDTLEEVIGLRGFGEGSLREFGIFYEEISLGLEGKVDLLALEKALVVPRQVAFIQRSCGYSWRKSLSVELIGEICSLIHNIQPECVCFVDNCYGELVEDKEPSEVGADLVAGSLIKNLGGTIVPAGGYVAGRADLVEKACCRLTAPGIGSSGGISFDLNRLLLQGLFLSPQMIAEALIGAELVSGVFDALGFLVQPLPGEYRSDVIQAVRLGSAESLKVVCKALQESSPVGSYLDPIPSPMPGYESNLVMAGGTFVDGSTSEFSADAPLRPPYDLYVQGCSHHAHVKIALKTALIAMVKAGLLKMPQTS